MDKEKKNPAYLADGLMQTHGEQPIVAILVVNPAVLKKVERLIMEEQVTVLSPSSDTERVLQVLSEVAVEVKAARQWYAAYRVLVDFKILVDNSYDTFEAWVRQAVPQHPHLPTARELRRLAVQSFSKQVSLWKRDNAPVSGKRFDDYLRIATLVADMLAG